MTCGNCEALREKIAKLERELGVRRRDGEVGALMARFEITGTQARVLLRMYGAKGSVVGHNDLMEELHTYSPTNLKKMICDLRQRVGEDITYNMHGHGYGLTTIGCSRVMAALEPPEMQAARDY